MTMLQVESKVKEQYERFRRELPVMQRGPEVGRWVLYLDGPKGYFDSEDEAYEEGVMKLGPEAGFVVARVESIEPVLLTAALAYFPGV
nr:hypothetical protein [Deltaproteobacteria bacterium]